MIYTHAPSIPRMISDVSLFCRRAWAWTWELTELLSSLLVSYLDDYIGKRSLPRLADSSGTNIAVDMLPCN